MPKKANLQERGQEMNTAISDTRTVKISEATTLITRAFKKKRPVFLWGPPGIGKSELVQGIGDSGALGNTLVIDMRLALFEPTDLRGYPGPDLKNGKMVWLPPADLPSAELAAQYDTVIVFLDEMNSRTSQSVLRLHVDLNRRIGSMCCQTTWFLLPQVTVKLTKVLLTECLSHLRTGLFILNYVLISKIG